MAFTFSSTGGSSGETSINVSATTNQTLNTIVNYYTLSNTSGHSVSMALTQKAAQPVEKYINIKPSSFEVEPKPSNSSIQIGSNDRWVIVSNSWIGLAPQYDKGDNTQRMAERSREIIEVEDPEEKYNTLQGSGNTIVGISFAENSGETRTGFISGYCVSDTSITACTSVVQIGAGANPQIRVYPDLIPALPASGLTSALTVTSNIEWTASTTDKYVHITSESESSGNGTVHFTVDPNTDGYSRAGGIKVANEKYNAVGYFSFKQLPNEKQYIMIEPDVFKVDASGSSGNMIAVSSNCEYEITADVGWIRLNSTSGSGNTEVYFDTTSGEKVSTDVGNITFYNNSVSTVATVTRQGVDKYISASTSAITAYIDRNMITFAAIYSNVDWNAIVSANGKWLTVYPTSGTGNGAISIQMNSATTTDVGSIILESVQNGLRWEITVEHKPGPKTITYTASSDDPLFLYEFYGSGGTYLVPTANTTSKGVGLIEFDEDVYGIGFRAFIGDGQITSLEMPDTVELIGEEAFCDCTGLTEITMSENIRTIERYAFYNCSSLMVITIPSTVVSIGDGAFSGYDTSSFRELYCYPTTPPYFGNIHWPNNGILHYPKNSDYSSLISGLPSGWVFRNDL